MERFGYRVHASNGMQYIKPCLYEHFIDCVKNGIKEEDCENDNILYFKILKNKDVVKNIHRISEECVYGYCYLLKSKNESNFSVQNPSKLYKNLMETICDAKASLECSDVTGHTDIKVKIGYYKLLSPDEFLYEIHQ